MSLKCSLLGHRYGDTAVRRNREQDGTELVETVREVRTCARCGTELVVSETTEVKTVQTPADADRRETTDADEAETTGPDTTRETPAAEATPAAGAATGSPGGASEADGGVAADPDAEVGPRDARERLTGSADTDASQFDPNVDTGEDTDEAPPAREDDAVFIDENGEERPDADWPPGEESGTADEDWEPDIDPDPERDTTRRVDSESSAGLTVPEGQFCCPECEFSTTVESSSLREGDFCPECHRGALEHRPL
jgi:hypothetical protein